MEDASLALAPEGFFLFLDHLIRWLGFYGRKKTQKKTIVKVALGHFKLEGVEASSALFFFSWFERSSAFVFFFSFFFSLYQQEVVRV